MTTGYTVIDVTPATVVPNIAAPPPVRQLRSHNPGSGPAGHGYGRGYEAAIKDRWDRDWLPAMMSGDLAICGAWDNITMRARDLVRNEPWARQAIERIVGNVIGPEGILSESEIEFPDGTLDDENGPLIDRLIKRWWAEECDADAEIAMPDMQASAMGETVEVGESFLVEVNNRNPNRLIPLCYQVIESEQVNQTMNGIVENGHKIKRGIEFDMQGRRVAYHFWTQHPYDLVLSGQDTARVPAERVIHIYNKQRPSQTRGITWFASILQALRDLGQYVGDEMKAARVGSLFTVAIKRAAGAGSGLGFGEINAPESDDSGNPLEYLGPGIIADLQQGDEVVQIDPKRPNSGAEPWIKLILATMANGIGLSYLGLTRDTKEASFSSCRFAQAGDKLFYKTIQGRFGRRAVLKMRQRAVSQLIALGKIPDLSPKQLQQNRHLWLATRLLPPGWEEIQVREEVNAAVERIRAGLSTLQEECAGRGRNYRNVLRQRARELALIRELDLDLSTNYPGQVNAAFRSPNESPDAPEGTEAGQEEPPKTVPAED